MEEILNEVKEDKEFSDKRIILADASEKLKNYSGKHINKFTIKGIDKHIKLIREFLKINEGMNDLVSAVEEAEGEAMAVDFI